MVKEWGFKVKELYIAKKKEPKKFADQLEWNKSEVLKCLFGIARQSKKNIVGMLYICGKDENIKVSLEDKTEVWKEKYKYSS